MSAPLDHGALTQEVMNLKDGHAELRQEMQRENAEMRRDLRNLDSKMDSGFALLSQKLDSRSKIDWTPISMIVSALLAVGAALYYPVREAIADNKSAIEIMRKENEARVVKLWDAENATARDLSYLQGQLHPLPPR